MNWNILRREIFSDKSEILPLFPHSRNSEILAYLSTSSPDDIRRRGKHHKSPLRSLGKGGRGFYTNLTLFNCSHIHFKLDSHKPYYNAHVHWDCSLNFLFTNTFTLTGDVSLTGFNCSHTPSGLLVLLVSRVFYSWAGFLKTPPSVRRWLVASHNFQPPERKCQKSYIWWLSGWVARWLGGWWLGGWWLGG